MLLKRRFWIVLCVGLIHSGETAINFFTPTLNRHRVLTHETKSHLISENNFKQQKTFVVSESDKKIILFLHQKTFRKFLKWNKKVNRECMWVVTCLRSFNINRQKQIMTWVQTYVFGKDSLMGLICLSCTLHVIYVVHSVEITR